MTRTHVQRISRACRCARTLLQLHQGAVYDDRQTHTHTHTQTHTHIHTHLQTCIHTHKAMEARPDKQIIWRRHYSPYECNNWFHYLVGISATLNEALDSVWFPSAGWSCALSSPTMGLCLHDVYSGPYLKSQRACLLLLVLLFVKRLCYRKIIQYFRIFGQFLQPVSVCAPWFMCECIFSLSGKQWWAGWEVGSPTLWSFEGDKWLTDGPINIFKWDMESSNDHWAEG